MNNDNIPMSLSNLDDFPNSTPFKDRFIQNRSTIDDLETELQITAKQTKFPTSDDGKVENALYRNILKINFNQNPKSKPKSHGDLFNFEPQKFKMPELSKYQERHIPKQPFKVLDAPNLQDDYYVNIIDWSSSNNIGVGLGNSCYLWNFNNNNVEKIAEFDENNTLTSLTWDLKSDYLAIGALDGKVEILDANRKQVVRSLDNHRERVGALSLYGNLLLSGSRDKTVLLSDIRAPKKPAMTFENHTQEVCGIKWSPDGQYFASGGNDNLLYIFSPKTKFPLMKKTHKAAVRAIAWSDRQYGILATGAGTADRCIRLWNLHERKLIDIRDTESQICNIVFSKRDDEIITSHGFSNNDICVWKTKGLKKTHSLLGHLSRVLHLAISPCGNYVVSGAGDETLRFWNLNYPAKTDASPRKDLALNNFSINVLR